MKVFMKKQMNRYGEQNRLKSVKRMVRICI